MQLVEGVATIETVDEFVASLGELGDAYGVAIQPFDARYVADRTHLERAVTLANRAFERGNNVARDRAVEILLYAAGRRQINEALDMGIAAGEMPVVVVVDAGADTDTTDGEMAAAAEVRALLTPDATLGTGDPARLRQFFDISSTELSATDADLATLVHERVALLVVDR